jgi:hypothetical protein
MESLNSQLSEGSNRDDLYRSVKNVYDYEEMNTSLLQSMDDVHQTQISTADS